RRFGPLEVKYANGHLTADLPELRRRIQSGPQNIWRYADFLPVDAPPGPSTRATSRAGLPAGCTPLVKADRLAERLGLREVWVKNDAANPTHSFKDRVVAVAAQRARELGFDTRRGLGVIGGDLPVFNGAQAVGCSPVAQAYQAGHDVCRPVKPDTIAKSLAIGNPADGPYAIELAKRSGGAIDAVTDDEIRDGIRLLAETTGIFTETAGGTTTATPAKPADRRAS